MMARNMTGTNLTDDEITTKEWDIKIKIRLCQQSIFREDKQKLRLIFKTVNDKRCNIQLKFKN